MLAQADPEDADVLAAEQAEALGGPCMFERTIGDTRFRLRPVIMISRNCTERERSYHSYTGEACAGHWAMNKLRRFLVGKEFTWMTDCSGLKKFFEVDDMPSHVHQRWRVSMLRYMFTIVHRPERLLVDCDTFNRYNQRAEEYRSLSQDPKTQEPKTQGTKTQDPKTRGTASDVNIAIPFVLPLANWPVQEVGPMRAAKSIMAAAAAQSRMIWEIGAACSTLSAALELSGIDSKVTVSLEPSDYLNQPVWDSDSKTRKSPFTPLAQWRSECYASQVNWLVINVHEFWHVDDIPLVLEVVEFAVACGATTIFIYATRKKRRGFDLLLECKKRIPEDWSSASY